MWTWASATVNSSFCLFVNFCCCFFLVCLSRPGYLFDHSISFCLSANCQMKMRFTDFSWHFLVNFIIPFVQSSKYNYTASAFCAECAALVKKRKKWHIRFSAIALRIVEPSVDNFTFSICSAFVQFLLCKYIVNLYKWVHSTTNINILPGSAYSVRGYGAKWWEKSALNFCVHFRRSCQIHTNTIMVSVTHFHVRSSDWFISKLNI